MPTLGTTWIARARLYNSAGRQIGTCMDTPNAIAKAFMEQHAATSVKESYSDVAIPRTNYTNRMCPGNEAASGYRANLAKLTVIGNIYESPELTEK